MRTGLKHRVNITRSYEFSIIFSAVTRSEGMVEISPRPLTWFKKLHTDEPKQEGERRAA
jgi:hypothetical protein